jgi:hypothetical protein
LACPEGIADVSVVVVACFENPLKEYSNVKMKVRVLLSLSRLHCMRGERRRGIP